MNDDLNNLKNYRPVSNLSFLSKIVESVAYEQINGYLILNQLHCSVQSGYRPHHSCETLMVKMFDDFISAMCNDQTVALILLDLSAAFDTIDHDLLLEKLKMKFRINGTVLKWITSYLKDRVFYVNIGKYMSSECKLLFGVLQGSILGPVLFTLYTKSLQDIAKKHGLNIQLYADDTQLNTFDLITVIHWMLLLKLEQLSLLSMK